MSPAATHDVHRGALPFPRSLPEFQRLFPDDAACGAYLERCRWPELFRCPACGEGGDPFRFAARPGVLRCRACRRDTSLTAGTIMHRTHSPLSTWFWAAYLVSTQTPGMSATQFQRQLGLTRYETSFRILHKLRAAMIRPNVDRIGGEHVHEAMGDTMGDTMGDNRRALVKARTYALGLPVIAHPPCQRWCRLAGLVEARWGHKRGEDGGCFASALASLRRCGGVLEHPAYSDAWKAYGLPRPESGGEWCPGAEEGEWTCYVEQWRYGHRAKKATWLYYVGLTPPPALRWGLLQDRAASAAGCAPWRDSKRCYTSPTTGREYRPTHVVGHMKADGKGSGSRNPLRLTKHEAIRTPPEFLEALIALARHSQAYPVT